MGLLDATLAMWRMDQVWFHIRHFPDGYGRGVAILWMAMGVKEDDCDFPSPDVPTRAEAMLAEADSLIPAEALTYALCKAVREAMDAASY